MGRANIFPGYLTAGAQTKWVDKSGNDTTGNGTFGSPYLTVQAAIDSIGDAASAKPYVVLVGPGVYATTFTIKPYVFVQGSGIGVTSLAPTAAQCLAAGFAGAGTQLSGIARATITTNLVANFSAIGSTGAGKVAFVDLDLQGSCSLTGATSTNNALLKNVGWQAFAGAGKNLSITDMANVDLFDVTGGFGNLTIVGHDAYFQDVNGVGVGMFGTLSITWTGSTTTNALDCIFDAAPHTSSSGAGGFGQPTVTGLGAIYACPDGIKFSSLAADADLQFNPFLGAGSVGSATAVIGCDTGLNHVIVNAAGDITLTLRKPTNGTRVAVKNQSGFNVAFALGALGVTGDPSYIGPYGYCELYFSSGSWMIEEQTQSGAVDLAGGVSAFITADISAQSRIVATLKTWNGAAGTPACNGADRVNGTKGTGGGFKVHAINLATGADLATDNGTYDWFVYPGKA